MPIPFRSPIDMGQLEILNALFQVLASDPSSPVEGQYYYNSSTKRIYYYNGTSWIAPNMTASEVLTALLTVDGSGSGLDADLLDSHDTSYFLARANHTGTQLASTVSDFDTQVRTSTLNQMTAPTADLSINSHKLTNVADGVAANDAATFGQLSTMLQGLNPKPGATVATAAALPACTYANGTSGVGATLTGNSNGALTVDSYGVSAGDIVLVKNQATAAENGLYTVTNAGSGGAAFILTRHTSMDTTAEFPRAYIVVEDAGAPNNNANSFWVCTNSSNPTVGSTSITFSQLNGATQLIAGTGITISGNTISINASYTGQASITTLGTIVTGVWNGTTIAVANGGTGATTASGARANLGATGTYSATIGNGSSTSFNITQGTHGLAANAVMHVTLYDASSGAQVFTDISVNNSNGMVTIGFSSPPTTNQYRVVIIG